MLRYVTVGNGSFSCSNAFSSIVDYTHFGYVKDIEITPTVKTDN